MGADFEHSRFRQELARESESAAGFLVAIAAMMAAFFVVTVGFTLTIGVCRLLLAVFPVQG